MIGAEVMAEYRIVERLARDRAAERRDLLAGLAATPAAIAPKYFYDALGCALFGAICELPEYYPTRTERAIFATHREAIALAVGSGKQFVDLGAGNCRKALAWLPFVAPSRYVAVDLARDEIATSLARMAPDFPEVEMVGIVTDFTQGLDLAQDLTPDPVTFFYPGSSIGNFAPAEARELLKTIRQHCAGRGDSGLLIGVDTKKDVARLTAAYDDSVGVTAAFNRNVLHHVNRLVGSDFRPEAFDHRAIYDAEAGRIEMHLVARQAQAVTLSDARRTFAAGEHIHTESSYKYSPQEFASLLEEAQFRTLRCWQDDAKDFAVFHAT